MGFGTGTAYYHSSRDWGVLMMNTETRSPDPCFRHVLNWCKPQSSPTLSMDTRRIHDMQQLFIRHKLNAHLFQYKFEDHPFTELSDIKASFTATNCSLKWHISSHNKPFLAGHSQMEFKPCLWVQCWWSVEFSVYSNNAMISCNLCELPISLGEKFYLFQLQKLLHMTSSCPHSPTIHKHYKNETLLSKQPHDPFVEVTLEHN